MKKSEIADERRRAALAWYKRPENRAAHSRRTRPGLLRRRLEQSGIRLEPGWEQFVSLPGE